MTTPSTNRIGDQVVADTVNLLLGGFGQRFRSRAQQLDHAVAGFAAEPLLGELVEQILLDHVGFVHDLAARPVELALQNFAFGAGAEISSGAHRNRAGRGRSQGGEDHLVTPRQRSGQSAQDAGGGQDTVLHAKDDFADVGQPLKSCASLCGGEGSQFRAVSVTRPFPRPVASPPDTCGRCATPAPRAGFRERCARRWRCSPPNRAPAVGNPGCRLRATRRLRAR